MTTETMPAGRLAYDHIGARVSWTIPDAEALLENETPVGDLDWISHTQGAVVVGVTFIEEAEDSTPSHRVSLIDGRRLVVTSDDYWLTPDTTVTLHREPGVDG